jgi:membrane associated rhomboid family serine protease
LRANTFLIVLCVAASFWAWQQNPTFAQQNLVFSYNNLLQRRLWTLVTALFVHANLLHLIGNMLFLFIFGNTLEKNAGARAHLATFFCGGFSSFLLSPLFMPRGAAMLGASAGDLHCGCLRHAHSAPKILLALFGSPGFGGAHLFYLQSRRRLSPELRSRL